MQDYELRLNPGLHSKTEGKGDGVRDEGGKEGGVESIVMGRVGRVLTGKHTVKLVTLSTLTL